MLHTTVRVWQQWEAGDRRMHPAFWELFMIKAKIFIMMDRVARDGLQ